MKKRPRLDCTRIKKRPSGRKKRRVADRDADARDAHASSADACGLSPQRRPLAAPWSQVVPGAEHPNWAQHFVDSLHIPLLNLKEKIGERISLVMWSDCAGKCTEKYASDQLANELKKTIGIAVEFKLHAGSDSSRHCKDFVVNNYDPPHFSHDIFKRDFDAASFECAKCDSTCVLPTSGVDIYFCCFPCGPWSKLGKRMGLSDPHGRVCWQAIKSIKHMRPVIFVMENVMEIGSASVATADPDDLTTIKDFMNQAIGDMYHSMTINSISPIQHGYSAEKKRVIVVGARRDQVEGAHLRSIFTKLIEKPLPVAHAYWTFLGIRSLCDETADSVGQLPTPAAAVQIHASVCKCGVDPMVLCPKHPCTCAQCKNGADLKCSWRAKAKKYLADHELQRAAADGCLTYIQALELIDQDVPKSPRERNMLNVYALLPAAQPLRSTMMIMDISQAIDRARAKYDGTVPTMATNARMWSMRAGRLLNVSEMAKLMGLDLCELDLRSTTEGQMRKMLGMSMHVATAGFALIGLLAAVGSTDGS